MKKTLIARLRKRNALALKKVENRDLKRVAGGIPTIYQPCNCPGGSVDIKDDPLV